MRYLSTFLVIVGLATTALYLTAAGPFENRTATNADTSAAAGDPTEMLSEKSLYHIESTWTNQESEDVAWSSLSGRPTLVAMFYTHCGFTCPRIVHDLKGILSELPGDERRKVGVVLVSIDPEHDKPEALKAFSKKHGLDMPQWTLLTGPDQNIRELAAALDVRYREQPGDQFAHSNTITLLDAGGEIVAQRDGFSTDDDALVAALSGSVTDTNQNR